MDKNLIASHLNDEARSLSPGLFIYEELDSTNSEAMRFLESGHTGVSIITADSQTAGRGRRGRPWLSPARSGLYMSVIYPFKAADLPLQPLSLVTAISTLAALEGLGFPNIRLKWPNDLLVGNKKLAGILLETRQSGQTTHVVFGVGVNYALNDERRAEIERIGNAGKAGNPGEAEKAGETGTAGETGKAVNRERPVTDLRELAASAPSASAELSGLVPLEIIAAEICSRLFSAIAQFLAEGFKPFQSVWNQSDRYYQSDIVVDNGVQRLIGKSLGVDEAGVLQLLTAEGRQKINAGEIFPSLRAADAAID